MWSEFSLASIFLVKYTLQCPVGLPWRLSDEESTCSAEDAGDMKIPWRRARQPTPVLLPGESHGQRGLAGYSPCDLQRVRHG